MWHVYNIIYVMKHACLHYSLDNHNNYYYVIDIIIFLGGANYVYPGANHTRFDHSIGYF